MYIFVWYTIFIFVIYRMLKLVYRE